MNPIIRHVTWKQLPKGITAAKKYLAQYSGETFTTYRLKNGRGDYGVDEIFSIGGKPVYRISIAGDGTDTQHFGI